MVGVINGVMTVLGMATFAGIVWWACSSGRAQANRQSAMLPFALPEEFENDTGVEGSHE